METIPGVFPGEVRAYQGILHSNQKTQAIDSASAWMTSQRVAVTGKKKSVLLNYALVIKCR